MSRHHRVKDRIGADMGKIGTKVVTLRYSRRDIKRVVWYDGKTYSITFYGERIEVVQAYGDPTATGDWHTVGMY